MIGRQFNDEESQIFSVEIIFNSGDAISIGTDKIKECYFIEDIFSFCKHGYLSFYDDFGIMEFGPITGNEKIKISYGYDQVKEYTFYITKFPVIEQITEGSEQESKRLLEFHFIDYLYFSLGFKEYSYAWKNTKNSDIVKDICKKFLNITEFNNWEDSTLIETEIIDTFYIPYWNIRKTLKWLLKRSSNENEIPGYLFYTNTTNKQYNFITLDTLLSNNRLMTTTEIDNGTYFFNSEYENDLNRILNWEQNSIDTINFPILSGNKIKGYNFENKHFISKNKLYADNIKNYTLLGKYSLFPDISNNNPKVMLTGIESEKRLNNVFQDEWIKRYNNQNVLAIYVKGHENRHADGMININWPSSDNEKEFYNKNSSGKYLIKSITHYFNPGTNPIFVQKMLCIKNGYYDSDDYNLVRATRKNI